MKSKRRHHSSSEDSEQSDDSDKSSSSSDSESEDSSVDDHRHKKKRKRASSSLSESDSEDHKRSKKRKHKKKKKKHGKKKRRGNSVDASVSGDEASSASDGDVSVKKKRKHKHKHAKRARCSSGSDLVETHGEHRLHSVVKGRRASSEDGGQPQRTYYQKEYHHPAVDYEREREVQRFYRGSSKERNQHNQEQQYYDRDRNNRYGSYQPVKYDRSREKYGNNSHSNVEDFNRRPQDSDEYRRNQRYEEHRYHEEFPRRPKAENAYHRENRGVRYNQYEDRGNRRQDYDEGRDYRDRRQHENENYRQREQRTYPDRRERFRDERISDERKREAPPRRERPVPVRPAKSSSQDRRESRSRSPDNRYRARKNEPDASRESNAGHNNRERDKPREERREASPEVKRERKTRFGAPDEKEYTWGKTEVKKESEKPTEEKEKPNFGLSGKLTADQNTVNGVVIKYTEPDDAKQPKRRWRFYPFKGDKALPILYIHRQSAFLIGRDKKVVDIALEHPSVSKQHSALQYRATPFERADGSQGRRVRPYIIDLDSANGTFVNNKKIEPRRYVELLERDVVKFGFSQREYVLLHENSKDEAQDDDNEPPPVTTTDQIKQDKRIKQEQAEDGE